MRRTRTALRATALAAFLTVASATVGISAAHAEPFHTSTMNKSWAPWTSTTSQGPQNYTVGAGTNVSMKCWNTGAYQDGGSKWFYIKSNAYPFTEGYVPANSVSNQWLTSPHC